MCKIAIIESYSLFGAGIKSILTELEDIVVVANAGSCDELKQKLGPLTPELILVDIIHGENTGVKQLKKIRRTFVKVPVLLITSADYAENFEEYIQIGVKGLVFSDATPDELVKAIKKIHDGDDYFKKEVWVLLKKSLQAHKYVTKKEKKLTEREVLVLKQFSKGLSYKEIGSNLNISPRTVETHKKNILSKLKITSTAEMIKYAFHNHMIA